MAMQTSNAEIAKLLRSVAAAYQIKKIGNIFQIRAYETAADAIEHSTADIQDLWQENRLDQVPGLGASLRAYLEELFATGKVKHFEAVKKGIPEVVFDLLNVPGVGPKTAQKIAELGIDSLEDLEASLKSGRLVKKGFSEKLAQKILAGLQELSQREDRMLLPYASVQADLVLEYLKKGDMILKANPLGSLRRMVATVGDLDFAVSSNNPAKAVDYFVKMPQVARVQDQGKNKASVVLKNGLRVDLLVGQPDSYGALLQHFTGSKHHNIHLRTIAEREGFSLSEYGVKDSKTQKVKETKTEEEFYKLLGMQTPAPEIREDTGEIEAAIKHQLPKLVDLEDIRGDLHLHSSFPLEPSHESGVNSIQEIIEKAVSLGYQYVGISDHPPAFTTHQRWQIIALIQKRTKFIQHLKQRTKSIRVLNGLEIDILGDGSLSVPEEALATLDYCIAGIHSGHRGGTEVITKRLLAAIRNPLVDIIAHPTNRLLNERESSDADWPEIFTSCAKYKKILEIDGYPNRLDLRDDLVRQAKEYGVKFIINTDAHEVSQMDNMPFGVSVARRGWASKEEIANTWEWKKLTEWFRIK